jgi:hypothetical protein
MKIKQVYKIGNSRTQEPRSYPIQQRSGCTLSDAVNTSLQISKVLLDKLTALHKVKGKGKVVSVLN